MLQRRAVIDYALARRATLSDLRRGAVSRREACDAHPDLLRAARHHGVATGEPCPCCGGVAAGAAFPRTGSASHSLVHVTYVFGSELGEATGRARARAELEDLARSHAELRVYVVEVCRDCSWNHLSSSFSIGTGEAGGVSTRSVRRRAADK